MAAEIPGTYDLGSQGVTIQKHLTFKLVKQYLLTTKLA